MILSNASSNLILSSIEVFGRFRSTFSNFALFGIRNWLMYPEYFVNTKSGTYNILRIVMETLTQ